MTVRIRSIDYRHDDVLLSGELAWDDEWTSARPGVLVVHDAMKSAEGFEEERAVLLAGLGYAGFVVDVYGKGIHASSPEESAALMAPFQSDRDHLQRRLLAAVGAAAAQPEVDGERLAAIGYCFGGMCVLDLARMNAPLAGIASFHGLLTAPTTSSLLDPARPIDARVLVLHGWQDPFVPVDTIEPFAREMSERRADWQLVAYGQAMHSFTNPGIDFPEMGAVYHERTARRSWRALGDFLAELFPTPG